MSHNQQVRGVSMPLIFKSIAPCIMYLNCSAFLVKDLDLMKSSVHVLFEHLQTTHQQLLQGTMVQGQMPGHAMNRFPNPMDQRVRQGYTHRTVSFTFRSYLSMQSSPSIPHGCTPSPLRPTNTLLIFRQGGRLSIKM